MSKTLPVVDKVRECERKRGYYAANGEKMRASARASHRKRWSGFSAELFDATLAFQGNACAICRRPFSEKLKPHADHDHDTKTPRGILCNHCNIVEGCVKKIGIPPAVLAANLAGYLANPPALGVDK